MTAGEFDKYASSYEEIINRHARLSGERFDYFVRLRLALMREALQRELMTPQDAPGVLDFGCGTGATEAHLREFFPNARITGVDTSPKSIAAARRRHLSGASFHLLQSPDLPFVDRSFDLIYSNGTLHHIPRDRRPFVIAELFRVLKKRGRLFAFENNPINPVMRRAMSVSPLDLGAKIVGAGDLKNLLMDAGFRVEGVRYYFFYPRTLKFLRFTERYLGWLPLGAQYCVRAQRPRR